MENETIIINRDQLAKGDQFLLSFLLHQKQDRVFDGNIPVRVVNAQGQEKKINLMNVSSTGEQLVADVSAVDFIVFKRATSNNSLVSEYA